MLNEAVESLNCKDLASRRENHLFGRSAAYPLLSEQSFPKTALGFLAGFEAAPLTLAVA